MALLGLQVAESESSNHYHYFDNRVLPSHVDEKLAHEEGKCWTALVAGRRAGGRAARHEDCWLAAGGRGQAHGLLQGQRTLRCWAHFVEHTLNTKHSTAGGLPWDLGPFRTTPLLCHLRPLPLPTFGLVLQARAHLKPYIKKPRISRNPKLLAALPAPRLVLQARVHLQRPGRQLGNRLPPARRRGAAGRRAGERRRARLRLLR